MKKYVKNITGGTEFPLKQELAYKEDGKIILLKSGEKKETKLKGEIGSNLNEPRLVIVSDKKEEK